ncbi:zinc-binding dehydrogenase [Rhodococcus sp. IEGM 1366]|uniref:zinc-binding dehydrogenase n=1 Tax=Rhodococcus sp. IEGM 1366 TaxID=3082223 RepID=UPI002954DFB4|nr:zinc-binding dehydrogenase [Rhodococcus sp. IEGM 1366]MDV8071265.1 zinc-binding dehydrogenase [Rhodococcus sp. IEGM 1366]
MKAISIQAFGDADGMQVIDLAEPAVRAGQVLIRTEAVGVGGVDAVIRRGTLNSYGFESGFIPGSEVAGVVTQVGVGVEESWIGRRVWAFTGTGGGYVEQALVQVENVVALPGGLSSVDAVTLGSAAPVAHFALEQARFAAGESVLVRGAAGSIGIAAVELASRKGSVTVTTSSSTRGERLRDLGATHVLDRGGNGDGPEAFDVIIDIVAGDALPMFIERLAPNGRLVLVGIVGGPPPQDFGTTLMTSFQRSLSVGTFSLDTVPIVVRDSVRAEYFDAAARGELHAVVDDVLPLERAAEAHQRMDDGQVFGRIVLTP